MRLHIILLFTFLSSTCLAQGQSIDSLLNKIDSVYANAQTYKDSGEAILTIGGQDKHEYVTVFKTVYQRDKYLSFSWYDKGKAFSYNGFQWDSSGTGQEFDFGKLTVVDHADIGHFVAGATGVSKGAAHTIPRLLEPVKISGNHYIRSYQTVCIAGKVTLDGQSCWLLTAKSVNSPVIKVWIDEDSLLIRQITENSFHKVTRYYPVINQPITRKELLFEGHKEHWAVFLKYFFVEYSSVVLTLIALLIVFINRRKNVHQFGTGSRIYLARFSKKGIRYVYVLFIILLLSDVLKFRNDPNLIPILLLILVAGYVVHAATQYLVYPDWIMRNRILISVILSGILSIGVLFYLFRNMQNALTWIWPVILMLVAYSVVIIQKNKKNDSNLRNLAFLEREKKDSITEKAWLADTVTETATDENAGRVVLMHDCLLFISKSGKQVPVVFSTIRNVRIHFEFFVLPVGLQLTDYHNNTKHLAIQFPYYWRAKIRRNR